MPDTNTAAAAGFQNAEAYEKVMGRWSRRLAPLLIRFGGLSDSDRVLDVSVLVFPALDHRQGIS